MKTREDFIKEAKLIIKIPRASTKFNLYLLNAILTDMDLLCKNNVFIEGFNDYYIRHKIREDLH